MGIAISQAATRFVAEDFSTVQQRAASAFYQAMKVAFILAVVIGTVVFLEANVLSLDLLGEATYEIFFRILALDIILSAGVIPVLSATLLGLHKFKETATVGILSTLLRQTLIIVLIIVLSNFVGLVIAWVLADLATASMFAVYVLRVMGRPKFDFPFRKLLGFSWPLCINNAVTFASSWFDRAILIVFVPLATLGIYSATITAFTVLLGMANAMATTLFPAFSTMQGAKKREDLAKAVLLSSRYASVITVPVALGLLATAKPALALILGPAYETGAAAPLMILAATFAVAQVGLTLTSMLLALDETRLVSAITTCSVAIGVVAAIILTPFSGIVGAALARATSMILSAGLIILILSRRLSAFLDLEAIGKSLLAGSVMASIVFVTQVFLYSKFLLPFYVLVGGVTYLAMLRVLKVARTEDISLIRNYLGNKLGFAASFLNMILLPSNDGTK